jgi:hypothetical protein
MPTPTMPLEWPAGADPQPTPDELSLLMNGITAPSRTVWWRGANDGK